MLYRHFTVLVCTVFVLAGGKPLCAQEAKDAAPARHHRLDALAAKLGLNTQQKEMIHKIHADFAQKARPLQQQLRALHHDQRQAMSKVLTAEQRAKVKEVIKERRETKWQATVAKLNLSAEQKQQVESIRQKYAKKFDDLAGQQGAKDRPSFRALRREKYRAIACQLTGEQRTVLWESVRQNSRRRRDPAARAAFWKGVGQTVAASPEQKEQFKQIRAEYAPKKQGPKAQLQVLRHDCHAAMLKVLTDEQRARFLEIRHGRHQDGANSAGTE